MKECFKCNIIKPLKEFYKHCQMTDGYINKCKICARKDIKISARNIKKYCIVCKKIFGTCSSEIKKGSGKFCSRICWNKWNRGKNCKKFKGELAGYMAKHKWIQKELGKPKYCEHCKSTSKSRYHWSNISGEYKRNVIDWQRLCVKCHSKYDNNKRAKFIVSCIICDKKIKTISKIRKLCSTKCQNKRYRSKEYKLNKNKNV